MRFAPSLALPLLTAIGGYFLGHWQFVAGPKPGAGNERPVPSARSGDSSAATAHDAAILAAASGMDATPGRVELVYRSGDPLGSARRLLRMVRALEPKDFADPAQVLKNFSVFGNQYLEGGLKEAYQAELVRRWFEVAPEGALAAVPALMKIGEMEREWQARGLLQSMAVTRPQDLIEAVAALPGPRAAKGRELEALLRTERMAFSTLAETQPALARRLLERFSPGEEREAAELAIAEGLAKNDPAGAVRLVRQPEHYDVLGAALRAAQQISGSAVIEVLKTSRLVVPDFSITGAVLAFPDAPWETLKPENYAGNRSWVGPEALAEARWLTPEQRRRLLDHSTSFMPGLRDEIEWMCLDAWLAESPREAADWMAAHAENFAGKGRVPQLSLDRWLASDPEAAQSWLEAQPSSPLIDRLKKSSRPSVPRWDGSPENLAAWMGDGTGKSAGDIQGYVFAQSFKAPGPAVAQLLNAPEKAPVLSALKLAANAWGGADPVAALALVDSMPEGPRRQTLMSGILRSTAYAKPRESAALVPQIQDAEERQWAAGAVYGYWKAQDAVAANAWLNTLPDLDPAWRAWLQREKSYISRPPKITRITR